MADLLKSVKLYTYDFVSFFALSSGRLIPFAISGGTTTLLIGNIDGNESSYIFDGGIF